MSKNREQKSDTASTSSNEEAVDESQVTRQDKNHMESLPNTQSIPRHNIPVIATSNVRSIEDQGTDIQNDSAPFRTHDHPTSIPQKRSAFSELMAPKPKQPKQEHQDNNTSKRPLPANDFSSSLLTYIIHPSQAPTGTIIRETQHTVLIRDKYPKALIHLLLLPKDPNFYHLSPFEAFNPPDKKHTDFLTLMRAEAQSATHLAASELSRLVSSYSKTNQARNLALESAPSNHDEPGTNTDPDSESTSDTIPPPRNFLPSVKTGIHASPSMSTLHIHIISIDNHSASLKTKKHYNSFNTDFFVPLDKFPLTDGDTNLDIMTREGQEALLKSDLRCWRCGVGFGNKFKAFKEHLREEYEKWRAI